MKLNPTNIRTRLQQQEPDSEISVAPSLRSAVLVLLCPGDAGLVTILTQRSADVPHHAGQICFPGGRVHADDSSVEATALRETAEETGLDTSSIEVLGNLPVTLVASSGFAITPVVAWTDLRPRFKPDPREVAALIECPLATALDLASYSTGTLPRGDGTTMREFWHLDVDGHYVWGATARILRLFALLLAETQDSPR